MNCVTRLVPDRRARHRWGCGLAALSGALLSAGLALSPSPVAAQAAYGSYIGAGFSGGVTRGGADEPSHAAGVVALRYKFLKAPFSIRTQALISDSIAIVPTISYDLPINWNADVYVGAGAAIPLSGDRTTPVGNQAGFAIQPGIDYVLPNSNLVVFGNAIISFDAYRKGGGTAASLQGGIGLRF